VMDLSGAPGFLWRATANPTPMAFALKQLRLRMPEQGCFRARFVTWNLDINRERQLFFVDLGNVGHFV
jgi:hypothetical protein